MVVKNRLKELQATSKYADAKYINLIEIIKQNENISDILEKAEIMIGRIKEYKKKVNDIREIHHHFLQEPSKKARENLQEKQEIIAMILVKIGGEIQSDLKREEEFLSNVASRRTMTPSEFMNFRVQRNLVSCLSMTFQESWREYSHTESEFKVRTKDELLKKVKISDKELNPEEIEQKILRGDLSMFSEVDNRRAEEARRMMMEVQDRHEEILRLEAAALRLHWVFSDAMNLVQSQGELLTRIEIR